MSMREEFAMFVVEHLGPHALTGGTMSIYEAAEKAWQAAYLAGAKAMQEEAKNAADAAYASGYVISAIRDINPETLLAMAEVE